MICRPVNGVIGGIHHITERTVVAQIFGHHKVPALGRAMDAHHISGFQTNVYRLKARTAAEYRLTTVLLSPPLSVLACWPTHQPCPP